MKLTYKIAITTGIILATAGITAYFINKSSFNLNTKYKLGQPLDSLNGVVVYYNGMVGHTDGRNTAPDGYNIGMKYQCVEFVKRYYYQRLNHKMPDAYGNAKDFYDAALADSTFNTKRGLMQFSNGSKARPQADDLLIFDGHKGNPYGHVAIVAWVTDSNLCIIQQNPGPFANSRDTFGVTHVNGRWTIQHSRALGWLRKVVDTTLNN
jgi:surface antigen